MPEPTRIEALAAELAAARAAFHEALADVDADLVTVPGVVDSWSVRDLVVHVAAWCDHASDALDLAANGRGSEFAYSTTETDRMNEEFHQRAARMSPSDALAAEEEAFERFIATVQAVPADEALDERLGNGDTVADVIRYDGPDHYAEHTAHLRAWFTPDVEDEE